MGGGEKGTGYWYVRVLTIITVETPMATACSPTAVTVAQLSRSHCRARWVKADSPLDAISTCVLKRLLIEISITMPTLAKRRSEAPLADNSRADGSQARLAQSNASRPCLCTDDARGPPSRVAPLCVQYPCFTATHQPMLPNTPTHIHEVQSLIIGARGISWFDVAALAHDALYAKPILRNTPTRLHVIQCLEREAMVIRWHDVVALCVTYNARLLTTPATP